MSESSHFGTNLPRTQSIRELSFPTCSMFSSSTKSVLERSLCGGRQIEISGKLKNTPISIISPNWNLNNYQLSTGLNKYPTLTYFSLLIYLSKNIYRVLHTVYICTYRVLASQLNLGLTSCLNGIFGGKLTVTISISSNGGKP